MKDPRTGPAESAFAPLDARRCGDASTVSPVRTTTAEIEAGDPTEAVYDVVFEMAETIVARSDDLYPELIGFGFDAGSPAPAHAERVQNSQRFCELLEEMLGRWPVVAHVCRGWSRPAQGALPDEGPRSEVVVIAVHSRGCSRMSTCRIERSRPTGSSPANATGGAASRLIKGPLRPMPAASDGLRDGGS